MAIKLNTEKWLEDYGDFLYRYALVRVRDNAHAEDLVQETFVAALKAKENYQGKSTERTWLVGILKHKIIDHLRKQKRTTALEDEQQLVDEDALFNENGGWKATISPWNSPDAALEQEAFWKILQQCIQALPERLRDLYLLREIDELDSDTVCNILAISSTNNMWVMLSRTRLKLRGCLENHWFQGDRSE